TVSSASPAANATCQLNGPVKHVVNLVFDNTHFRRDRPNVPSDLEQMPHLLDFMKSNGTLFTNDHTVLISHTSNGILSMLTGLYPDRNGMTVGNSYGFFGNAIHCGNAANSKCAGNAAAKDDLLSDEPGGYSGFKALYGTKYVDPAITGGKTCVNSTAGSPVADPLGNCGFPGFDGMFAQNTLGYAEQMLENGVPVIYGYFSDIHDCHVPNTTTDSYVSTAQGPGESCAKQQLAAYDAAFNTFFTDLNAHGINKSNTLFVITVDEGDHFAGGTGVAQPDGTLAYAHTNCSTLTACPGNQIGEVNANLPPLLPAGTPGFAVHSDDA